MTPETRLFLLSVEIHRTLVPELYGLPNHRRVIREADFAGDIEFCLEKFREMDHPDLSVIEAVASFAGLPADALPHHRDIVAACR